MTDKKENNRLRFIWDFIGGMGGLSSVLGFFLAVGLVFWDTPNKKELSGIIHLYQFVFVCMTLLLSGNIITAILEIRRNQSLQKRVDELSFNTSELEASNTSLLELHANLVKTNGKVADIIHNIAHRTRDFSCIISTMHASLSEKLAECKGVQIKIEKSELLSLKDKSDAEYNAYREIVVRSIKDIFDILTKSDVGVAIKIFQYDTTHQHFTVQTLHRDETSSRERKHIDKKLVDFPLFGNTAFETIFLDTNRSYFFSNDLQNEKNYNNMNKEWYKFYNACLVIGLTVENVVGAVCVDNKNGSFNDKEQFNILATIADNFALALCQHRELRNVITNQL